MPTWRNSRGRGKSSADLRLDPGAFRVIGRARRGSTSPRRSTAAPNSASTSGSPTWCSRRSSTAPPSAARSPELPGKPCAAIAVVACKAPGLARCGARRLGQRRGRGGQQYLARDAPGELALGQLDAARLRPSTWTARRFSPRRRRCSPPAPHWCAEPKAPAGTTPAAYAAVSEPHVAAAIGMPTIAATYTLPYLAHATMEVLNCTARITFAGNTPPCEIWAPTQAVLRRARSPPGSPDSRRGDRGPHDVPGRRPRTEVRAGLRQPGDPDRDGRGAAGEAHLAARGGHATTSSVPAQS